MENEKQYLRDLAEIRSMMERSTRFLSLSGWAGILAGIYALAGAFVAWKFLDFNPDEIAYGNILPGTLPPGFLNVFLLSVLVLSLALVTAILDSLKKAGSRGEKAWNPTSRRLLAYMAVPLTAGGILVLILISKGLIGLAAPMTLLFYGLALVSAGRITYNEVNILGLVQIILGLVSCYYIEYGLLLWAIGFGAAHIVYGIYMHFRYGR